MKQRSLRIASLVSLMLTVWLMLGFGVAHFIVRPRNHPTAERKDIAGKTVENVTFEATDGVQISAWLAKGRPDRAVVLAAGIDADRGCLVGRGEFYLERGFTVLLPDLRGTGSSAPSRVTIGWEERKDILGAVNYLKSLGCEHIGVDGISLGASAIAYSMQDDPDYAFVVLESCYDSLDHAWRNRLAMFNVPNAITLPVRWFAESMIGQPASRLAPVDYMDRCTAPTLIVAGDSEPELKVSETDSIFQNCAAEMKQLYLFKGGRHQDFLSRFPEEYKSVVGDFLDEVSADWTAEGLIAKR